LSARVRDVVLAGVLVPQASTGGTSPPVTRGRAATTLAALLRCESPCALSPAERALLCEWLTRLTDDDGATPTPADGGSRTATRTHESRTGGFRTDETRTGGSRTTDRSTT
ncbi:hypothetical protein ACWEOA_39700, partial [Streptomyces sp. NPDC004457]